MIRSLIADDHEILREGLKYVVSLSRDISVVGEAADAESALQLCRTTAADVSPPGRLHAGTWCARNDQEREGDQAGLKILVLSVHPEEQTTDGSWPPGPMAI